VMPGAVKILFQLFATTLQSICAHHDCSFANLA